MTYRDDLGALRTRLANLEAEQAELAAKQRELEQASSRLDEVAEELADARRRFDKERRLPLLDRVTIATPCAANWGDMVGDERVRFCGACEKNVYNVAALTREEAEDVIRAHEGDVCMRLYKRSDGTILTADCPVGVKRKRRRRLVAGVLVAAGAGVAAALGGATEVMGEPMAGGIEMLPYEMAPPNPTHDVGPNPSAKTVEPELEAPTPRDQQGSTK